MAEPDFSKPWFHGSPQELTELRAGSTITQDPELARVFSHKPALVSISDNGTIKHNGQVDGFLYAISETVQREDVKPHSRSTMAPGKEWLTTRPLIVALVGRTTVAPRERLSRWEHAILILRLISRQLRTRHLRLGILANKWTEGNEGRQPPKKGRSYTARYDGPVREASRLYLPLPLLSRTKKSLRRSRLQTSASSSFWASVMEWGL